MLIGLGMGLGQSDQQARVTLTVTLEAPVAGTLADQVFTAGTGGGAIDFAPLFTGQALAYDSSDPARLSIDAGTGLAQVTLDGPLPQADVTVTASNDAGSAQITFGLEVLEAAGALNTSARFASGAKLATQTLPMPFPGNDAVADQDMSVVMRLYSTAQSLHDGATLNLFNAADTSQEMWLGPRQFTFRPGAGFSTRGLTTGDIDAADPAGAQEGRWTTFMWRLYQDPGNVGGGNRRTVEVWRSDGTLVAGTFGSGVSLNGFDTLSLDRVDGDMFDLAIVTGDPAALRDWLADDPDTGAVRARLLKDYDFASDPACDLHLHVPFAKADPGQPDAPSTLTLSEPALTDRISGTSLWGSGTTLPVWGPRAPFPEAAPAGALTLTGTPEPGQTLTASRPVTFFSDAIAVTDTGETAYEVQQADRGRIVHAVDAQGNRSPELRVPHAEPTVLGGAPTSWVVASGSGPQTFDLTTIFAGTGMSFDLDTMLFQDESFNVGLIEAAADSDLYIETDDFDPFAATDVTVTASNSGGQVSHTITVAVSEMVPQDLSTRFPEDEIYVSLPGVLSDHYADAAGTTAISANDDFERIDFATGNGHAVEHDSGETRNRIDVLNAQSLQVPPHHTDGVFEFMPNAEITVSPNHFIAAGVNHDSDGTNASYILAQMEGSTTTRMGFGINGDKKAFYFRSDSPGGNQNVAAEGFFKDTNWSVAALKVEGTDVSITSKFGVEELTLDEAVPAFTTTPARPITWGGRIRAGNPANQIDGFMGPLICNFTNTFFENLTDRIVRFITDNVLEPRPNVYYTNEPTLTESGGDLTYTPGSTLSNSGDTITVTEEFYWNGVDVSGDMVAGPGGSQIYTMPAGIGQFIVREVQDNGFIPKAQRILHHNKGTGNAGLSGSDLSNTITVQRYAFNGQMVEFNQPVGIGNFVVGKEDGDPQIVKASGAQIVAYYPEAVDTDYEPARRVNGAMLNPRFDQKRASSWDSGISTSRYSRSRDISLQLPIALDSLTHGDSICISTSASEDEVPKKTLGITLRVNVFTVVDTVQQWDTMRPPTTWPAAEAKPFLPQPTDVMIASLPTYDDSAYMGEMRNIAAIVERYSTPCMDYITPQHREHMSIKEGWTQYGRDFMGRVNALFSFVMANYTVAEKRAAVNLLAQSGMDRYGTLRDARARAGQLGTTDISAAHESDGGHNNGRKPQVIFSMNMLEQDWMPEIRYNIYQEDDMCLYATEYMYEVSNGLHPTDTWAPSYGNRGSHRVAEGMVNGGVHPRPLWRGDRTNDPDSGINARWNFSGYMTAGQNNDKGYATMLMIQAMGWDGQWADNPFNVINGGVDDGRAFINEQWLHYHVNAGLPDPWRFRGGTVSAYDEVPNRSTTALTSYSEQQFIANINDVFDEPWERAA